MNAQTATRPIDVHPAEHPPEVRDRLDDESGHRVTSAGSLASSGAAAMALRDYALAAHEAGLCVVPPRQDGTRAPTSTWRKFQSTPPTVDQLKRWYAESARTGIGYVCSTVSGGLEGLDFDEADAWHAYESLIQDHGLELLWHRTKSGYLERTPSGGYHVLWRTDAGQSNQKLARRPKRPEEMKDEHDKIKTLIETRAEGGYVVAAPSHGQVHPSGKPYELVRGGVDTIATITADERESLLAMARMVDQIERKRLPARRNHVLATARQRHRHQRDHQLRRQ
jgi:putative DNA primase/helicase